MTKTKVIKPTRAALLSFAEMVARMTNESEIKNGFTMEDAFATVNQLIREAREITGINPMYPEIYCMTCDCDIEDCDCERPGECLTCGTQCDEDGICPVCARLERAQEKVREAEVVAGMAGEDPVTARRGLRRAKAAVRAALAAEIESCRKCGGGLTLADMLKGDACTDEGEEEGNVFVYCSESCRETH
jgi:hypothetical protein